MAEHLFHIRLVEQIKTTLQDDLEMLASGGCPDFADYKHRCGRIAGLKEAIELSEIVQRQLLGDAR